MDQASLPLQIGPPVRRGRGRPKGAKNTRSLDLARYVEAQYGGLTPGQQSAALCLVTPADLKAAFKRAAELRLAHPPPDRLACAMVVKACELALALGCDRVAAWALIQKERADLMPYIHQKQPQAPPKASGEAGATAFLIPEGLEAQAFEIVDDDDDDMIQVVSPMSDEAR